ncbi:MAG TPA: CopD family protein [Thermomicrobiales bacterium]|nr:CopD family protein [Thermomicrobiales bacterium]
MPRRPPLRPRPLLLALCLALLAAGGLALPPRGAAAHAFLVRTFPAAGSVVGADAGQVRLTFTEGVDVRPDGVAVTDGDGRRADARDARVAPGDPATVVVSLPRLADGVYTVAYTIVSDDGHPESGSYRFGVGVAPGTVAGGRATAATLGGTTLLEAAGRWLLLLALVLLIGPAALLALALPPPWRARDGAMRVPADAVALCAARAVYWGRLALALALVGLVVGLVAVAAAGAPGGLGGALNAGALEAAFSGRFGGLWLLRVGLLLPPALALDRLAAWPATERRGVAGWWLVLASGALLLLATAFAGHAATTDPVALSVLVDWVHLGATALWLGGLLGLALLLRPLARSLGAAQTGAFLAAVAPRFSTLAFVCVELLIVTGLYQAWAHVATPAALGATAYGRALLVKLGLVVPLLGLAAVNHYVALPRLRRPVGADREGAAAALAGFRRTVWGEAALGVAVLLVVGLLTALPPARQPAVAADAPAPTPAAAAAGVTLAANAGPTLVTLTIAPPGGGPAALTATLQDPVGQAVTSAAVTLRLTPPGGGAPRDVSLAPGGGRFAGSADLSAAGPWRIEALVTPAGGAPATATFSLALPAGGARPLLAWADEAMNHLSSLRERQTVSSGGPVVAATYEYVAPDRLHLVTAEGETIVTGKRRFDRLTGQPWAESVWPEDAGYRWPRYDLASTASEVTLLGEEEVAGQPCWIVAYLDTETGARYTIWIGERDHLLHQQRMAATGHYMESTFDDFDAPLAIEPPQ